LCWHLLFSLGWLRSGRQRGRAGKTGRAEARPYNCLRVARNRKASLEKAPENL